MKRYFYLTIHFSPQYEGTVLFKRSDGRYADNDGGVYRKRLLYDFGWGQEDGFELMPPLPFCKLIDLIEHSEMIPKKRFRHKYDKEEIEQINIYRSNLYGAVSVIMQDHVSEFVDFLYSKADTDYFDNPVIKENYKCFSFYSEKTKAEGKIPGGVLTRSYEDILNDYPKYRKISSKIISCIYD